MSVTYDLERLARRYAVVTGGVVGPDVRVGPDTCRHTRVR